MAGGISLHCVDVSRGYAMTGLQVEVFRVNNSERKLIANGKTDKGVLNHPMVKGEGIITGQYEVVFHVADYYRSIDHNLSDPPFIETVTYPFGLANEEEHYHLPMKMTPYGFSLFRGN